MFIKLQSVTGRMLTLLEPTTVNLLSTFYSLDVLWFKFFFGSKFFKLV